MITNVIPIDHPYQKCGGRRNVSSCGPIQKSHRVHNGHEEFQYARASWNIGAEQALEVRSHRAPRRTAPSQSPDRRRWRCATGFVAFPRDQICPAMLRASASSTADRSGRDVVQSRHFIGG
jgi:hypothetical protein